MATTAAIIEQSYYPYLGAGKTPGTSHWFPVTASRYARSDKPIGLPSPWDESWNLIQPAYGATLYSYIKFHHMRFKLTMGSDVTVTNLVGYTNIGGNGSSEWGAGQIVRWNVSDAQNLFTGFFGMGSMAYESWANVATTYYDSTHTMSIMPGPFTVSTADTSVDTRYGIASFLEFTHDIPAPAELPGHNVVFAWDESV